MFQSTDKEVHTTTVRRTLNNHKYNGRIARKKPYINEGNRKKRLIFAKEYILKDSEWWNEVIFADEGKFNVFGSDGRKMVWRKKNEKLLPNI